jgi:hypothetical protein
LEESDRLLRRISIIVMVLVLVFSVFEAVQLSDASAQSNPDESDVIMLPEEKLSHTLVYPLERVM